MSNAHTASTDVNARADSQDDRSALRNTALQPTRATDGRYLERDPRGAAPWPKGRSGNPGGRPRGASILAPFLRELAVGAESDPDGFGTKARELAAALLSALTEGDVKRAQAILAAMDRTDGPVERQHVRTGPVQRLIVKLPALSDPQFATEHRPLPAPRHDRGPSESALGPI